MSKSVEFFDQQFRHQSMDAALKLNPFEEQALPYLSGDVLDFGSGMGNLAFAAAKKGCKVTALDASSVAVNHIRSRAAAQGATVSATQADLRDYRIEGTYDCVVSIGLLMFFDCPTAFKVLAELQEHVRPGGYAIVNVLIEGTSYLDMFDSEAHCLFAPSEMLVRFSEWEIERSEFNDFEAPHQTMKRFSTVIARKPYARVEGGT
ncbi:class I SAM-dependent methyltransferase [Rhodoferax sp. UBA5149]|uniref:class I SAM-dependent methyltransferase n=1 Tax=Rhodoferax sp. UBA5149 TaxID=1947379 RepID=UPI0025ED32F1|nr:class I SAM-dependent methyltransferase [Rhodoferax sp. UBA5149]